MNGATGESGLLTDFAIGATNDSLPITLVRGKPQTLATVSSTVLNATDTVGFKLYRRSNGTFDII